MVRVNIDFPEALHKQVKSQASLQGKKLKDYIIEGVKNYADLHSTGRTN